MSRAGWEQVCSRQVPLHAGAMWWPAKHTKTLKPSQPIVCTCCSCCNVTQKWDSAVTFACFKLNQAWHTLFTNSARSRISQGWRVCQELGWVQLCPALSLLSTLHCTAGFLRALVSQGRRSVLAASVGWHGRQVGKGYIASQEDASSHSNQLTSTDSLMSAENTI